MLKPIIHDLEYESKLMTSELKGIDVTSHYLKLLENAKPEEIEQWADEEYAIIDPLRDILIEDPSLVDEQRQQRPWAIYSADLVTDLSLSLGLNDDVDPAPVELVARWLERARTSDVGRADSKRRADALNEEIDLLIERFDLSKNLDLVVVAVARLMSGPGGLDAVMPAINLVGASDPATALRTAADVARRIP
jgi:hypothetical protein